MKKIIAATTVALALATTASAELKVGVGFNLSEALNGGTTSIRVPLDFADIGNGLRIEPELGFKSSTDSSGKKDVTDSSFVLAVGGYYNLWTVEKLNFYAGGRLAIENSKNEYVTSSPSFGGGTSYSVESNKYNTTAIQGLFGAEYGITEDFTVAAQAGLQFNVGDTTGAQTVGHVVLRYFFIPIGGSNSGGL